MKQIILDSLKILRDPFSPAWINIATNPFWLSRRALCQAISDLAPDLQGTVLDFGCGTAPYRKHLGGGVNYVGLEFDSPKARSQNVADLFYDGRRIPLADGAVNGILSTQSLEHVPDPELTVSEWARVTSAGGVVLATVPFMWPEHEVPWDFHRFTRYGLINLFERHGFKVIEVRSLLPDCRAPAQLFLAWFFDTWIASRGKIASRLLTALVCPPVVLLATLLAAVSPRSVNTYLDNVVLARRCEDRTS